MGTSSWRKGRSKSWTRPSMTVMSKLATLGEPTIVPFAWTMVAPVQSSTLWRTTLALRLFIVPWTVKVTWVGRPLPTAKFGVTDVQSDSIDASVP